MSSARAERLVNLVLCLLSTRQFLAAERIRSTVPGYADAPTDDAFFRMFERDKTELRELGVPLETGRNSGFDTADGYRIARHDYELGEIDLEPDEAAAVALAARLWDTPGLAGAAHGAVVKLRAAGVEVDETGAGPVQPRVRAAEPAFGPLLAAVQAGRAVTFAHRRGGPTGAVVRRTVEPWGVVSSRGRWYLVGHDRDRDAVRAFRLSRVAGPVTPLGPPGAVRVPPGVDLVAVVDHVVALPPVIGTARLWVAAGRAHGLRRLGKVLRPLRWPASDHDGDGRAGDELEVDLRSVETVARWVAGFAPDAAVVAPPELAVAVRRSWAHALAAHLPSDDDGDGSGHDVPAPRPSVPPTGLVEAEPPPDAPRRRRRRATSATDAGPAGTPSGLAGRLPRLLSLVPYLLARPGVPLAAVAADFGVGEEQLRRDLELLWMCGLPGYGPGDLVDLSFAGDTVTVTEDAGLRRPLRLTTAEATALLVALRTLGDLPGMVDTDAVRRATAKIERAVGRADTTPGGVAVEVTAAEQATTAAIRAALDDGRALRIRYYTAGRDAVTRRTVDPMRLLLVEGRGYLEAWCRRAEAVRLFRLDRVDDVAVLAEPAAPPPDAAPADVSAGVFPARPEHGTAVLLLEPWARWIAEYYPVEEVAPLPVDPRDRDGPEGRARVLLRYADPDWLVRLVLGLGGGARVLEPPAVAAEVARRARAALTDAPADTPQEMIVR